MGKSYWLRVVVLIFALIGVIAVIRQLQSSRGGGAGSETASGNPNQVNICPTRVAEVHMIGGPLIFQRDMKWFARVGANETQLDTVAVEKWFSSYCTLAAEPAEGVENPEPLLKVSFVAGEPETLFASPQGFRWKGQAFKSQQLQQALQDLTMLPPAGTPGK